MPRAMTTTPQTMRVQWKLATAIWPNYDEYVKRTTRTIPVVVLERTSK